MFPDMANRVLTVIIFRVRARARVSADQRGRRRQTKVLNVEVNGPATKKGRACAEQMAGKVLETSLLHPAENILEIVPYEFAKFVFHSLWIRTDR